MKRLFGVAVSGTLALATCIASAPVHATVTSGSAGSCPVDRYCSYHDNNFLGGHIDFGAGVVNVFGNFNFNDETSSISNPRNFRAWWYENNNLGGWSWCLSANKKDNDLPNAQNDEFSSSQSANTFVNCP